MKTKKIEEKIIKKFNKNPSEIRKFVNLFRNLVGILISFRFITLNLDFYSTIFKEFSKKYFSFYINLSLSTFYFIFNFQ